MVAWQFGAAGLRAYRRIQVDRVPDSLALAAIVFFGMLTSSRRWSTEWCGIWLGSNRDLCCEFIARADGTVAGTPFLLSFGSRLCRGPVETGSHGPSHRRRDAAGPGCSPDRSDRRVAAGFKT